MQLILVTLYWTNKASFMRRSILSFNITQGSGITLRALELLQIVKLFNSRPLEQNLCSNAPPKFRIWWSIFFVKSIISDRDILLIYQALKPRPVVNLFLSHSLAKVNYLYLKNFRFKNVTLLFRRKTEKFKFPTRARRGSNSPPPGTNDSQMPVGCPRKDFEASHWSAH